MPVVLNRILSQLVPLVVSATCGAVFGGQAQQDPLAEKVGEMIDKTPLGELENGVILQSGDIKISLASVAKVEAAYVAASRRQQPKFSLTPAHQAALRKMIAFQLLRNAVAEKHAADNKLACPDEEFNARFEKFKERTKQQGASYEQSLADNGLTDEDLRHYWRANWALEDKIGETVSDADVAKAVGERQDHAALRRVSHILFMYKGGERAPADVTRTKEEARAAAEDIIKKLKNGEDFAKLAKEYSDCPSKSQGGDLNFFPRKGAMVQPFSEAAYSLAKVGDFTQTPVETPFGFHVIKLTELRSDEELKKATRDSLINEKLNKQIQELLEEAAGKAKFNAKLFEK